MPLNNFVHHRNGITAGASTPPPSTEGTYHDRAHAQALKITRKKTSSPNPFRQQASHAAQAPSQSSNNYHGSRFNAGIKPRHQEEEGGRRAVLDSDVETDFDVTRSSDMTLGQTESENGQGYYPDYEDDHQDQWNQAEVYFEGNHMQVESQRNQSSSPSKVRRSVPATTGPYTAGHHRHHSDLPIPSNQNKGHIAKKRGRTEEQQIRKEDVRSDVDEIVVDGIGEPYPKGAGLFHGDGDGDGDEDEYVEGAPLRSDRGEEVTPTRHLEEGAENSSEQQEYRNVKIAINPNSSTHPPDFTEEELKKMEYSKLSTESWESTHEAPDFQLPEALKGSSLEQRVDHYAFNKAATKWDDQVAFYQSLNTKEWDQAGDHLLSEIGKIFSGMKEAKKQKRIVLEEIEAEIEAREKLVRGKSANIDAKFSAMQAGGEGLLKGRN